jgi:sulfoquinovosidase
MIKNVLDGFEIYDDDHLIIKHTLHEPSIFLGDKTLKIDMENGEFKFQDDTVFKPVKPFEIKGDLIDFVDFQMEIDKTDKSLFRLKFHNLNQAIKIILPSNKDESIYGMGEQFTSLNLKGYTVKNWVQEHITRKQIYHKIIRRIFKLKPKQWKFENYKTYFIAPTFISSRNYFCHINTLGYATFDFSNQDNHQISIYSKVSHIDFCKKPTLLELSGALSKYVGMMPKLPEWIYDGMIFAIQGGTKIINDKIDILNKNEVKINGVWSQDWCGELYTFFGRQVFWNWEVDPILYPDLESNIKTWKTKNIHFLAYVNPYLNANGKMYQEALKLDYLVKNIDQTPFLTKATSFDFGIVDLTNMKAYEWFKNIIKKNYINIGIMGWMADFGEYLPVSCSLNSGSPEELHNHWPDLWAKLNREVLEETNMLSSALFFNRAGYKDNSQYSTLIWNGDQHVDFTDDFGMASALRAMLSLSFSGIGFSHSDIGGYTTVPAIKRNKTLYIRWLEMNTFVPVMRSHEGNKPWKNVQFDDDDQTLKLTSKFTNIHVLLKPYFLAVEKEYQAYGYPMIRPLMFHHDYFTDKAFMLGKDLLVYPVLSQRSEKQNIYIPKGHWIHLFTGKRYSQEHIKIKSPLGIPAVFYNEDSIYIDVFNSIINYLKTIH